MTNKPHIDANLESELETVKEQILAIGRLVESQVGDAVRSLVGRDTELANRLKVGDKAVNQMELAIDEQCIRVLALYQPEGSDLRFIASAIKMVTDLERIGHLAVDMIEDLGPFVGRPLCPRRRRFRGWRNRLIAADRKFERPVQQLCSEVSSEMQSAPRAIERDVALPFFARRIKRITLTRRTSPRWSSITSAARMFVRRALVSGARWLCSTNTSSSRDRSGQLRRGYGPRPLRDKDPAPSTRGSIELDPGDRRVKDATREADDAMEALLGWCSE